MADTVNPRLYQDAEWLRDQVITQGKNSRDVSREQKVSYHLVELYLEKFNIPFKSTKPAAKEGE